MEHGVDALVFSVISPTERAIRRQKRFDSPNAIFETGDALAAVLSADALFYAGYHRDGIVVSRFEISTREVTTVGLISFGKVRPWMVNMYLVAGQLVVDAGDVLFFFRPAEWR